MNGELFHIETRDHVLLDGIVAWPRMRRGSIAAVWVHGLGSSFSGNPERIHPTATAFGRMGIPLAVFNTRGHDIVTQLRRTRPSRSRVLAGAAFERFTDCVHDIRAVIDFLHRRGSTTVVLMGHSTGANKIVYYVHKTQDPRVRGVVLLGGVSDIAVEYAVRGKRMFTLLARAEKNIARGKGDAFFTIGADGKLISARRYVSLHTPGGAEDVFPYVFPGKSWVALRSIRVPMLALIGAEDQYLDRPAEEVLRALAGHAVRARSFHGIVIDGTNHGFSGKEKQLAGVIVEWIQHEM